MTRNAALAGAHGFGLSELQARQNSVQACGGWGLRPHASEISACKVWLAPGAGVIWLGPALQVSTHSMRR